MALVTSGFYVIRTAVGTHWPGPGLSGPSRRSSIQQEGSPSAAACRWKGKEVSSGSQKTQAEQRLHSQQRGGV